MKVFIVDPSLFSPTYDAQFCTALAGEDLDVTLMGRQPRDYEEVEARSFKLDPMFYRVTEHLPSMLKPLARLGKGIEHALDMQRLVGRVREQRPDIIHVEWAVLPFIDRFFFKRLRDLAPMVLTVHNTVPFHGESSSKLMQHGHGDIFSHFDHFIPHTEAIRDHLLKRGIAEERMTLLPHPVIRLPSPEPSVPAKEDAPKKILFFGNIKHYKGVDILVQAGLQLASKQENFHITIAGKAFMDLGPLEQQIEQANAGDLFTIIPRYLSEQELANALSASDIIVFPYREIDASGAFSCATQFGKPVIATDIGTFSEAPISDHVLRIRPEDADLLETTLKQLIDSDEELKFWAERSVALRKLMYSWEKFAADCVTVYRGLRDQKQSDQGQL